MSVAVLAHVARLHYRHGLTKLEIAERLGMSRFKVARLLERARAEGVVRVEIEEPLPIDEELSQRLEAAFGLQLAVVVPEDEIPRATAAWLPELLRADDVLGVAWGTTLSRVVEQLPPRQAGIPVVQICGAVAGLEAGTGPGEVALRFADRLGGPLHALPAPALTSRAAMRDLLDNPAIRPTVELFDGVTVALAGIGARPDGRGHLLVHVFDEQGTLEQELPAIALSLEQLRRVRLVAAAGGAGKEAAVAGALRTGLLDVLVTDGRCARHALA